ncbi:hypothetical protein ACIHCQ_23055 [Streptomyces sp. NPDC052236]|uniref:hypothetical protein n=1 Tax=Streptomyces sp. NPDC052236 TaxID=3365686 RepID=UPI0037D961BC
MRPSASIAARVTAGSVTRAAGVPRIARQGLQQAADPRAHDGQPRGPVVPPPLDEPTVW